MAEIRPADETRRRLGGVSLILAPVLLAAGELLRLSTGNDGTEVEVAGLTDDSESVWIAVGALEVVGVIVVFPALFTLLHVFTRRASSLGHLAVGLLITGFVCQAVYAGLLAAANGSAARLTRDGDVEVGGETITLLRFANTLERPLVVLAFVAVAALFVGLLALANAIWSSRVFPRWTAIAIGLAAVSGFALDYGLPYLLLIVPWGWIGWRILRSSPVDWEGFREPVSLAASDHAAT